MTYLAGLMTPPFMLDIVTISDRITIVAANLTYKIDRPRVYGDKRYFSRLAGKSDLLL